MAKASHLGINGGWVGGNKAVYSYLGDDDGTFGAYRDLESYTIVIEVGSAGIGKVDAVF